VTYVLLEPVAGTVYVALLLAFTAWANQFTAGGASTEAIYIASGLFVASWIAQFIGHGVFEKRAPALLDNLFQALVLAPLFVWLEILFYFGYRPELQKRVKKMAQKEISKMKSQKQIKAKKAVNGKK
jgi:uncharacterized membrane protein YGL010W